MAKDKDPFVFNESRRHWRRFSQVMKGIRNHGAFVWLEFGQTFRDATYVEALAMQKEQAQKREGLVYWVVGPKGKLIAKPYYAEIPGLSYEPSASGLVAHRQGLRLLQEARQFVMAQV